MNSGNVYQNDEVNPERTGEISDRGVMNRKLLCLGICIAAVLCGCGKESPKANVTLKEMSKYEHNVTRQNDPSQGGTAEPVVDSEGFTVTDDTVYVMSNTLNVRTQPKPDADQLQAVPYGTKLHRTGIGPNGWDRVYFDNTTAYVSNDQITELRIQDNRSFEYSNAMLSIVDTSRQNYSYDSMCKDLTEMRERYGSAMKLNVIGTTRDDRSIFEIVIGDTSKAKKHIFFCGGMCGAEYMSSLLCMKQAEYYLCYYETGNYNGFAYKDLCDNAAIHIVPMLNPDSVMLSQEYLSGTDNPAIIADLKRWFERDRVNGGTSLSLENYLMFFYANANGTDLRKNFPYQWDKIDAAAAEPASTGYRGSEPGCEPESVALIRQLTGTKPDLVVAYHTTGATVTYNYGQSEPLLSEAKSIAKSVATIMNYGVKDTNAGIAGYGSYEGYCNVERGIPALSIALGNGSTPLALNEFIAIWTSCRQSWAVMQLAVINKR